MAEFVLNSQRSAGIFKQAQAQQQVYQTALDIDVCTLV
jgi:hypothetical protein